MHRFSGDNFKICVYAGFMSARYSIPYLDEVRHTPHICLAEGLRSANRAITKRYSEYMLGLDISPAQASLLMRLYYLRKTTMLELAKHMETDRTTITRNVELLARDGLVTVTPGEDRRSKIVALTDEGFKKLEETVPKWRQAQNELQDDLGSQLWDSLLKETRILTELGGFAHDRQTR